MEGRADTDPNVPSRPTERVGKWTASSTSSGHGSQSASAEGRESHGGITYGQGNYHATMFTNNANLQQQPSQLRSNSNYQAGQYYDQSGYNPAGMSLYDPKRMQSHISTSSVGSKSSTMDQSASPITGSYYSLSLVNSHYSLSLVNSHQAQIGNYPTSFPHYHQTPTSNVEGAYHVMRSMSGSEMGNVVGMQSMDPNLRTRAAAAVPPPPYANTTQQDPGVYHQQYPTGQAGGYGTQQAFYPNAVATSGPNTGAYPAIMSEMQGYSQPQYTSPSYGIYQPQYAMNPYPTHQQTGATYYANPRPEWNGGQQWSPSYYTYPSAPLGPPTSYTRSSRSSNNNLRSRGPSFNTLPMRPSGSATPMSSSSEAKILDNTSNVGEGAADNSSESEARVPGKGLRQRYHPQQGPRSDHVLWCGNVPSDASIEELWDFFSRLPPDENAEEEEKKESQLQGQENDPALSPHSGHGVLSVFIIARSNCAFVNYATPRHLKRAVNYFHGQSLRPADSRCPKLVCRVRKKDDEAQAGVAGQRGRGIHVAWVKEQDRKHKQKTRSLSRKNDQQDISTTDSSTKSLDNEASNHIASPITSTGLSMASPSSPDSSLIGADEIRLSVGEGNLSKVDARPSISAASFDSSSGSISYTSTNSSLFRHPAFHERFFILKSLGTDDLDRSVQTGLWATQPHNEQVLDQAYRNSESVYLIFSANQSGGFYGYARMAGTILLTRENQQLHMSGAYSDGRAVVLSGNTSIRGPVIRPEAIPEADEAKGDAITRGNTLGVARSSQVVSGVGANNTTTSPLPLTPGGEVESPLSKMNPSPQENFSWPVQRRNKDKGQGMTRSQSLSNDASEPTTIADFTNSTPALTMTEPSGDEQGSTSTLQLEATVSSSTVITSIPVPMDENGVRRKDMVADITSVVTPNESQHTLPASLSDIDSLGPTDSVSYDTKSQHQLAVRALIHNLRLEERGSILQAEQLEKSMTDSEDPSNTEATVSNTPRAGSSDSFGKPFKVEWIKSTSLSFSQVRRLRNPWRDNRQVKVSRDGTELEPNVGRLLLKEWERVEDGKSIPIYEMAATRLGDEEEDDDEAEK